MGHEESQRYKARSSARAATETTNDRAAVEELDWVTELFAKPEAEGMELPAELYRVVWAGLSPKWTKRGGTLKRNMQISAKQTRVNSKTRAHNE